VEGQDRGNFDGEKFGRVIGAEMLPEARPPGSSATLMRCESLDDLSYITICTHQREKSWSMNVRLKEIWVLIGSAGAKFCHVWIAAGGRFNATGSFLYVGGVTRLASHAHTKTTAPLSRLPSGRTHHGFRGNSLLPLVGTSGTICSTNFYIRNA
jgi:hypothetical protein